MRILFVTFALLAAILLVDCSGHGGDFVFMNSAPSLAAIGNQVVQEGNTVTLNFAATDADTGDVLSFSVTPILPFASLTDNGDGTASYVLTPQVGDTGVYTINVTAIDNGTNPMSQSETLVLSIPDINSSPVAGLVRDANTMLPLAGAVVVRQATPFRSQAAGDGSYQLFIPNGTSEVIVAGMKGYLNSSISANAGAAAADILLTPVTIGTNLNYTFVEPTICGICHPNQEAEWNGSPMAVGGTNLWVHDIYAGNGTTGGMGGFVYTRDSVFAGSNPDSECAACHQPEKWVAAGYSGPLEGPGDAIYPSNAVNHGISCDMCHKIADVDVAKINFPGIFPGAVTINLPSSGQVMYGPYPDADYNLPNTMVPAFQPQLVAQVCGTCHQDKNDVDEDHTYTGITSEPTYTEWEESAFGDPNSTSFKTCVDCHMPATTTTQACEVIVLNRDPSTIRSHAIEGTNSTFLENAVELSMQTNKVGAKLEVTVAINNSMTGHHVPTGVTIRNMILLVEAWVDGNDPLVSPLNHTGTQTIHTLGGVGNPAQGYYAGLPGKFYAKVNHDANMQGPTFFTDATGIQFDSRIPALTTDTTNYTFDLPPTGTGTIHVRARLIYRRSFRFLVDAKGWTTDGHGHPLEDVAAPHYGHLMEEETEDVTF